MRLLITAFFVGMTLMATAHVIGQELRPEGRLEGVGRPPVPASEASPFGERPSQQQPLAIIRRGVNLNEKFEPPLELGMPLYRNIEGEGYVPLNAGESGVERKIMVALAKLKSENSEERADAEDALRDAVEEVFELRSKSREDQIDKLEARINALRDQLQKRRDKKAEICRLHVLTLINQANGLGF